MTTPNPKDSMKSTWRTASKSEWTVWHWFYEILQVHPSELDQEVPVHNKSDKVPHVPSWQAHRYILLHAFIPMVLHQTYVAYTGKNFGVLGAFLLYGGSFKITGISVMQSMRRLGHKYGYFDGDKHARDGVPDVGVAKVVRSLLSTTSARTIFALFLSYRASETPLESLKTNWAWALLEVSLYGIILDFWFYWYHRLMHDVDWLWKYHRTHHLTKHPNPLLTLYADEEQEFFDIAGIPLMTYGTMRLMGMPMGFYEWWICYMYVVFAELAGHSGLRVHISVPSPVSWVLSYFNAELVIEDHDLHHRTGWKSSHNYGKQTRLWDRVFGTCRDRIETTDQNIDYVNTVKMDVF